MQKDHFIWITGIGASTPLGHHVEEIADNLVAGRSGIRAIEHFDASQYTCRVAGLMDPIPCPETETPETFAAMSRWDQLMLWCTVRALKDAGLYEKRGSLRIGFVAGIGAEWAQLWEQDQQRGGDLVYDGNRAPESMVEKTCRYLGLQGPTATVGAACASGNIAIGQARRWLQEGWVDVCLAGGFDLPVTAMGVASFANLGAPSRRNDAPQAASRPFDMARDGFVMGEGGTLFVLERSDRAKRRNARVWAEVAGFGASSDASHLVIPSSDPALAVKAIQAALLDANVQPGDIDYINAHATSTPVGDRFETLALQTVLGEHTERVPVSGTKSMSGHLLSAASAFETLACIAAMENDAIPPTLNLDQLDPECRLCHVPHQARSQKVRVAVNNSFGFGGSNTCVVLRKVG